jgi:hypothetical protein
MDNQQTPETKSHVCALSLDMTGDCMICAIERERDEARAVANELADIASKYLSFLLAVTPTKANETHEKDTMKVIDALKRWKKL